MSNQMITSGSKVFFTPVNGRTVRMTGSIVDYSRDLDDDGNIVKLATDELSIEIGSLIRPRPKLPYKVNIINPVYDANKHFIAYDLSIAKMNKSTIFVCPLLGGKKELFLWDKYLVNCFVRTIDEENIICLLYRWSSDKLFTKFETALQEFKTYKYHVDTDPFHVMYVFGVPEGTKASYEKFLEGKYSEIDDLIKLKILDYHNFNMDGTTAKILFKSPSLKQQLEEELDVNIPVENELHSPPNLIEETFNPEYYKIVKKNKINKNFLNE